MMPLHDDAVTGGGQWLLQPPGALGWPRRFGVQAIPALASSTATPQVDLAQDLVELLVPEPSLWSADSWLMGGKMPREAGKNCRRRQTLHAASYRPGPIIPPNQVFASATDLARDCTAAPVRLFGGFQVEGEAAKITRGVPTVGQLPNGATIKRQIEVTLATLGQLRLSLSNPDFTTAKRIAIAVNEYIGALRRERTSSSAPCAQQAPCHAIAASFQRFSRGRLPPPAQTCRPAGKNCRALRGGGANTAHRPRAL
jgi:hypothetical protein